MCCCTLLWCCAQRSAALGNLDTNTIATVSCNNDEKNHRKKERKKERKIDRKSMAAIVSGNPLEDGAEGVAQRSFERFCEELGREPEIKDDEVPVATLKGYLESIGFTKGLQTDDIVLNALRIIDREQGLLTLKEWSARLCLRWQRLWDTVQ